MILILTCDGDFSSDIVIDWLSYFKEPFIRINSFDFFKSYLCASISSSGTSFIVDGKSISFKDINSVWYRKFGFFKDSDVYKALLEEYGFRTAAHISKEFHKILSFFMYSLSNSKWLTNYNNADLNKLEVLTLAMECNFNIPKTYLVNTRGSIERINNSLISKSVHNPIISEVDNNRCMMYTSEIKQPDIKHLPKMFFPSLVQDKIDKQYEVRVFYIDGACYSMVIFSQDDKKTKLDFRQYNWSKPNRFLPYILPRKEEIKVSNLMERLKLNCGSLDLIKGLDGKYYFLEVNSTGQFGMVDFPCNYGLHRIVAQTLIKFANS